MDSITQIALGAAVGEATLGKQVGKRALLWGGLCGLLPDLDIFIPFADAVKEFTYHRGMSHSLFVLSALTPLFVWVIQRVNGHSEMHRRGWYALVFLVFTTHVMLDCLTVYGTQILWPLTTPPVMWSTIFIIDPAYSVPLIGGVLAALVFTRKKTRGHVINTACIVLSTLYLVWTVGAKIYVTGIAHESLRLQNVSYEKAMTIPTPFNTLLWRVLVVDKTGYYEGFYSLFDKTKNIRFRHYPSDRSLLQNLEDSWAVKRLQWFTHGFYSVRPFLDNIVMTDLRMGLEPLYAFQFNVGVLENPHAIPTISTRVFGVRSWDKLNWVWQRIWTTHPEPAHTAQESSVKPDPTTT